LHASAWLQHFNGMDKEGKGILGTGELAQTISVDDYLC